MKKLLSAITLATFSQAAMSAEQMPAGAILIDQNTENPTLSIVNAEELTPEQREESLKKLLSESNITREAICQMQEDKEFCTPVRVDFSRISSNMTHDEFYKFWQTAEEERTNLENTLPEYIKGITISYGKKMQETLEGFQLRKGFLESYPYININTPITAEQFTEIVTDTIQPSALNDGTINTIVDNLRHAGFDVSELTDDKDNVKRTILAGIIPEKIEAQEEIVDKKAQARILKQAEKKVDVNYITAFDDTIDTTKKDEIAKQRLEVSKKYNELMEMFKSMDPENLQKFRTACETTGIKYSGDSMPRILGLLGCKFQNSKFIFDLENNKYHVIIPSSQLQNLKQLATEQLYTLEKNNEPVPPWLVILIALISLLLAAIGTYQLYMKPKGYSIFNTSTDSDNAENKDTETPEAIPKFSIEKNIARDLHTKEIPLANGTTATVLSLHGAMKNNQFNGDFIFTTPRGDIYLVDLKATGNANGLAEPKKIKEMMQSVENLETLKSEALKFLQNGSGFSAIGIEGTAAKREGFINLQIPRTGDCWATINTPNQDNINILPKNDSITISNNGATGTIDANERRVLPEGSFVILCTDGVPLSLQNSFQKCKNPQKVKNIFTEWMRESTEGDNMAEDASIVCIPIQALKEIDEKQDNNSSEIHTFSSNRNSAGNYGLPPEKKTTSNSNNTMEYPILTQLQNEPLLREFSISMNTNIGPNTIDIKNNNTILIPMTWHRFDVEEVLTLIHHKLLNEKNTQYAQNILRSFFEKIQNNEITTLKYKYNIDNNDSELEYSLIQIHKAFSIVYPNIALTQEQLKSSIFEQSQSATFIGFKINNAANTINQVIETNKDSQNITKTIPLKEK